MPSSSRAGTPAVSRLQAHGFKRYYETVIENVRLVLACIVITLGAAAAYVTIAPRTYSAQAQMLVSPLPATASTLIGLPVLHASSSDPTRDVLTAASLTTTSQVAAGVVKALQLRETPSALLAQVQATPIGQSDLLALQATASSAAKANAIANQFALQVVATRNAALNAAIDAILPGLRAQAAALPPSQRNGPGTLGDQIGQLELLRRSGDPTITIASPATLPGGPTSPRTNLVLAAGLFGGLILGIGAAFGFQSLDPRLRREEQLRELFEAPVLARIPREPRRRGQSRPMLPRELSFGGAEGYRTLRTILTSRAAGKPTAVLVTGSSPAEGKTTSAINLAAALAQGGSRVILIEADLRRPTIAATLGLRVTAGTEQVLAGAVELEQALTLTRLGGREVSVLAVRQGGEHLADHLSFSVAQRLITQAKELADFIVIDSPPLTAVIDALPLAQSADEVLIVARVGTSKLTKLSELHDFLLDQGNYSTGVLLVGEAPGRSYHYDSRAQPEPEPDSDRDPRRDIETVQTLPGR